MNKTELVKAVADDGEMTVKDAGNAVSETLAAIQAALVSGGPVILPGFGTFTVVHKPARTGRNPQTGLPLDVEETWAVKFKPGKVLKAVVHSGGKTGAGR